MKRRKWLVWIAVCMILQLSGCGSEKQAEGEKQCTILIECNTILDNIDDLMKEKKEIVPEDGVILKERTASFREGESVYDVLTRVCKEENILMEASFTAGTGSVYVEGIANLYEFDCGELSGWEYSVNGDFPSVSCSDYILEENDKIAWRYTCDLGEDLK